MTDFLAPGPHSIWTRFDTLMVLSLLLVPPALVGVVALLLWVFS